MFNKHWFLYWLNSYGKVLGRTSRGATSAPRELGHLLHRLWGHSQITSSLKPGFLTPPPPWSSHRHPRRTPTPPSIWRHHMNLYIQFYLTKIYAIALINIQDSIDPLLLNLDELDGSKVKESCNRVKFEPSQVDDHTEWCRLVSWQLARPQSTRLFWNIVDDELSGTIW